MQALEALGHASRARTKAKIIGVTGSAGKTGTKEALYAALDRYSRGRAHRSVKSYNNHVGVPLSLARMPADCDFGIFEMGMNHAGEIAGLTTQVCPHVAVITTIAPAHIENLGSEEAIVDAKAEIFDDAGIDDLVTPQKHHALTQRLEIPTAQIESVDGHKSTARMAQAEKNVEQRTGP